MGFDDIQLELGVGMQCGQCQGCARSIWEECVPTHAVSHLQREQPTTAAMGA
ncbi:MULTISPECIES: (2Fe-2S)-binding protein [Acidovorax]|uniref:(2Fe-2S)-binding protein n=2 Tax=Acidovorax TaxID=12916 RepID=UPI001F3815A1